MGDISVNFCHRNARQVFLDFFITNYETRIMVQKQTIKSIGSGRDRSPRTPRPSENCHQAWAENVNFNRTSIQNGNEESKAQNSWERDTQEEGRKENEKQYAENAKKRRNFDLVYKSVTKQKAPARPEQAFMVSKSAKEYEGGKSNDGRATPKPDFYNPQFLENETYFDVWGKDYRQWFRSQAKKGNKKKSKEVEKPVKSEERAENGAKADEKEREETGDVEQTASSVSSSVSSDGEK